MSDIFISYARTSEPVAKGIAEALRGLGYGVWRDDELPPHRSYAEVIEERLVAAKAVVVVWCKAATHSQWVRAEADLARGSGKLVQITLDGSPLPLPFNQIQCANLAGWTGDPSAQVWRQVVASVAELAGAPGSNAPPPPRAPAVDERVDRAAALAAFAGIPPRRAPPRLSIVVLPFSNLSRDPDQDYFVDGVTESLTTDLSRIHGSFVIARNTAFTFKGRAVDAKQVGEDLGVRYVLEGSVQRGSSRLRINVQLIDVETGAYLWAERFDKPIADMLEMEDEIVTRLARALDVQLVAAEARRADHAVNPDSMDLYFQGQAVVNLGFGPDEAVRARALWERALELDPENVDALAALAQYNTLAVALAFTADDGAGSYAAAEAHALKAISLAPNHANAHLALAQVYAFTDRIRPSLAEYQRALALDRNLAHAYAGFAASKMYGGEAEAAEADILEAFRLSPQDARGHLWCLIAGASKLLVGEDAQAEAWFRRGIEINRSYPIQVLYLAGALAGQGRMEEAKDAAREALRLNPRFSASLVRSIRRSTNADYVRQLATLLDKLRAAGIPD